MKKILVTGLNGFTGHYVKNIFEKNGYEVIGLLQESDVVDDENDNSIICDITNYEALHKSLSEVELHGVIHLAALSFVAHDKPLEFYAVNTIGTENLLRVLKETQKNLQKVVLASSSNVYGQRGGEMAIKESDPMQPISHYAISKAAMEYVAHTFFDFLPIVIMRPFNYTGVGQSERFLIPKIVSHYKKKMESIELGNIDVERDFLDVRDVAGYYFELFESDAKSESFNLCSGKTYSIKDIMRLMDEIAGYEIKIEINPDFVRSNEIKILKGDREKLDKLSIAKEKYDLADTLKWMYEN